MKKVSLILVLIVWSVCALQAQEKKETTASDTIKEKSKAFSKEEENRNVMLNAENNAGPREVNIGLPFTGDVTILENGNTVVGSFWPQNPLSVWRYDKSLGRMGLLNYQETAVTTGGVGYTVDSYMREGGRKFRGFSELKFNSRGRMYGSVNLSGKVSDGLFYSASATVTRDPGATDLSVGKYADKSELFKFMLTKKFAKRRGKISIAYKHAEMRNIVDRFFPFRYKSDGSINQIPGFDLGKDSFLPRDGVITGVDPVTGEDTSYDLVKDNNTVSNVVDLMLDYKFKNKWRLKFSGRYHKAKSDNAFIFPASLGESAPPVPGWEDLNGNAYSGPVAFSLAMLLDNVPTQTITGRLELSKKVNKHGLRFGANYIGYNTDQHEQNTFMYTTVEKNPRILRNLTQFPHPFYPPAFAPLVSYTNDKGHIGFPINFTNFNRGYDHYETNKTAVYFTDDIDVSKRFKLSVGARAEYFDKKSDYFTKEQRDANVAATPNAPFSGTPSKYTDSYWNFVGSVSADYRLTSRIGLLGQYTIHANGERKEGYGAGIEPRTLEGTQIKFARLGVYYNHPKLSVVSALTSLQKTNLFSNGSYSPPFNPGNQSPQVTDTYSIQTLGWTTDVIAKPFKNFELHYLLTLQKPEFKDRGVELDFPQGDEQDGYYNFSNTMPGMSKVIMEIDPACFLMKRKVKVWGSLRYFGKTSANLLNTLEFESRWETFAGVDCRVTKNLNVNVGMNNLLDQRGVKGEVQGSATAKDGSVYDGTLQVAQMLLPRMANLTIQYKF